MAMNVCFVELFHNSESKMNWCSNYLKTFHNIKCVKVFYYQLTASVIESWSDSNVSPFVMFCPEDNRSGKPLTFFSYKIKSGSSLGTKCVGKKIHGILFESATPNEKAAMLERFAGECELLSGLHHSCIIQFSQNVSEKTFINYSLLSCQALVKSGFITN